MTEAKVLDLKTLQNGVTGGAAALRCRTRLEPAGGDGDKVFPPTYEGGKYAVEKRIVNGQRVDCVVLDSVASQANRIELALLRACKGDKFKDFGFPLVSVDFSGDLPDIGSISHLEAPHRIADAILRDSTHEGKRFRESEVGKSFTDASTANATALFRYCPTALVFGMWDSTGPKGGAGAKFARCLVSEVVGIDVEFGRKTSSRIDPLQIPVAAGPLYEAKAGGWTLDESAAKVDPKTKKAIKLGKDGKPSEANHGNVTPTVEESGGVTMREAVQFTTLSLPGLRRLHFPGTSKNESARDDAARTALAALALCGTALAQEEGLQLRSRCLLVATEAITWELLGAPGSVPARFKLTANDAIALLRDAVAAAKAEDLAWEKEPVTLKPLPEFVKLVQKSRALAAQGATEVD